MKYLSRKEEQLLLVIWKLGESADGVAIRESITESTQNYWSIGGIYYVLDRLTRKAYVSPRTAPPTSDRGGRSKRYYRITENGKSALAKIREIHNELWDGLPGAAEK